MIRRYLTPRELQALLARQNGMCAVPGCGSEGPFEADHSTVHAWDNKKPDQLLCVPCHKKKTKRDIKNIAKVNRITGKTRSQWNGDRKGRKIQGAGFRGWRRFDGSIVEK